MTCREISDKMFTQALRGFVKVLRAVHKSSLGFPGHLITNFPNVMVLLVILSNSTGISRVFAKRWITKRWVTKRWVNLLFNGRRCPNLPKSLLYLARLRHCHKDTIIELKIAQIVTVLLVEQCRNQHSYHGWTMLLTTVGSTTLIFMPVHNLQHVVRSYADRRSTLYSLALI